MSNYNSIAKVYDALSKIVFGNTLLKAQKHFFQLIPNASNVLVIGGGTGTVLTEILKAKPHCKIDYVEASSEMLKLAKKRVAHGKVNFILGTEQELNKCYDVIITPFVLDLFPQPQLEKFILKLKNHLQTNGLLLVTDFYPSKKPKHQFLYWLMKLFFKVFTRLQSNQLYYFDTILKAFFKQEAILYFYDGFVFSGVYINKK